MPAGSSPSLYAARRKVNNVGPGIVGVELTLGLGGRRFAGGASGKANSPGRARLPALATLSALGSYIRFACEGGGGPTLALESVSEFSLGGSRVAVVVVTMSGHATPLIASWPLTGASGPAVVRATLEATARRVTGLSTGEDRGPWGATELVESDGVADLGAGLHQQAESLLESARAIASARVVPDSVDGLRIHVLATSEMSRREVARMVKTLLEEGIDLDVRLDQITVVQSRLSEEELNRVLGRTSSISSPVPSSTSTSPASSSAPPASPSTSPSPTSPSPSPRSPNASPAEGMTHSPEATGADRSPVVSRLTLVDLHVVSKTGGTQEVGVRNGRLPKRATHDDGDVVATATVQSVLQQVFARLLGGRQGS